MVRDLRGIAYAFNSKISYMMLFDWIFPAYTQLLLRALDVWANEPQVTTPLLKLFAELAQNRLVRDVTHAHNWFAITIGHSQLTLLLIWKYFSADDACAMLSSCMLWYVVLLGHSVCILMFHHQTEFCYSGKSVK